MKKKKQKKNLFEIEYLLLAVLQFIVDVIMEKHQIWGISSIA